MAALEGKTPEEVLSVHQMNEERPWSISEHGRLAFSCNDPAGESRTQALANYLEIIRKSGTTALYTIKWYDIEPEQKITSKTENTGSFNFKFGFSEDMLPARGGGGVKDQTLSQTVFQQMLELQNERFKFEMEKLNEKHLRELERLEEDLEEEDQPDKFDAMERMGNIAGNLGEKYPWLQEIIKDVIGIAKNLTGAHNNNLQPAGAKISGMTDTAYRTDEDNRALVNDSIGKLAIAYSKKYRQPGEGDHMLSEDLALLARLAQQDPALFDVAINKLRLLA